MPLPNDEKIIALSQDLIQQFDTIFGLHPGYRPAHAKGAMLTGTFTPSSAAASLTRAPHMNRPSTRIMVRFSDSTGIPGIPDTDPNAHPSGCAIRFYLGDRVHTDIIGHSIDGFPVRTGQEFLEFLRAAAASDPAKLAGSPLEGFLGSHHQSPGIRASAETGAVQLRAGGLLWRYRHALHEYGWSEPIWEVPHNSGCRRRASERCGGRG